MCIDVIIAYYFPDPWLQSIVYGFFLTLFSVQFYLIQLILQKKKSIFILSPKMKSHKYPK